jgi:hypothetical protein
MMEQLQKTKRQDDNKTSHGGELEAKKKKR